MTSVYCVLMYSICLLYSYQLSNAWNTGTIKRLPPSSIYAFTIFIGFFFVTNCINGDFYHTMEKVHSFNQNDLYFFNGEPIYREITTFVNNNYLLFRTIVWGGAFIVFCITARRMRAPLFMAVSIICISYNILFCYSRATAAMAVYFCGLSFFCCQYKKKLLGYVVGIFLILFSRSFHSSAVIMILMTLALFLPARKWSIVLAIIAIPIIAYYLKDYYFIYALDEETDEFMSKKLLSYSERGLGQGIANIIISFLRYASIYIPIIFCYKSVFNKREKGEKDVSEVRLFKVIIGLVYASTVFLFFGGTFYTFFYRILQMTIIPIALLLSRLYYEKKIPKKHLLFCLLTGVLYQFVHYSYMIYLNR